LLLTGIAWAKLSGVDIIQFYLVLTNKDTRYFLEVPGVQMAMKLETPVCQVLLTPCIHFLPATKIPYFPLLWSQEIYKLSSILKHAPILFDSELISKDTHNFLEQLMVQINVKLTKIPLALLTLCTYV